MCFPSRLSPSFGPATVEVAIIDGLFFRITVDIITLFCAKEKKIIQKRLLEQPFSTVESLLLFYEVFIDKFDIIDVFHRLCEIKPLNNVATEFVKFI